VVHTIINLWKFEPPGFRDALHMLDLDWSTLDAHQVYMSDLPDQMQTYLKSLTKCTDIVPTVFLVSLDHNRPIYLSSSIIRSLHLHLPSSMPTTGHLSPATQTLRMMCSYTQVVYQCAHLRFLIRGWCKQYSARCTRFGGRA